jgi:hypothetical protein
MRYFQIIFIANTLLFFSVISVSQDLKKFNLYKPDDKAETEIASAVSKAKNPVSMFLYKLVATGVVGVQDFMSLLQKIRSLIH